MHPTDPTTNAQHPSFLAMSAPVARRVRSADGTATLVAHDYGGSGADCLLTHGNGLHGRAYAVMIQQLTRAGLRVVALDQRGAGDSVLPEGAGVLEPPCATRAC
jgi:alpha-beta hydrolase superfamily lysophospholipase